MTALTIPVVYGNRAGVHEIECPTCGGTGKTPCNKCNGDGGVLSDANTNGWDRCRAGCDDDGTWPCDDCDTTGNLEITRSAWDDPDLFDKRGDR